MLRRVASIVIAVGAVASVAACGTFFTSEEREPWRAEVEAACLASGAVHESAGIRIAKPIEGPGTCGLDHPFRVASLDGTGPSAAFASMRPPAPVPDDGAPAPDGAPPAMSTPLQLPDGPPPQSSYQDLGGPQGGALPGLPAAPAVRMRDGGPFAVSLDRSVVLSCSMIPALTRWLATDAQPAALANFGSPIVEMTSFGSYSCRRRDNASHGRMSEHAYANAIDVKGFRLADGRETTVLRGWRGSPQERSFWRDVAYGACRTFTTVLGPGTSDGLHENHLHLDLARHSAARQLHVCRPRVPADWVATAQRSGMQPAAPEFTGSIVDPMKGEDDQ
ncbi:extensin-like domain-containing protein [Labrys wisconsinensis]|uniref:Extensin-like C-terminal domain-containing protein n=1 Tax=Labrys wisconsinensis TaxID=425677 RepID=A0ABU0JJD5_9HYPH|nr:extensin family protein [Labrys wisconsinensis]MDQ0473596.1 hypothetical protein [Labrys wisconsinensis]